MKRLLFICFIFLMGCRGNNEPDITIDSRIEIREFRKPVIGLINVYRVQNGLNKLQESEVLNTITNDYADLMASRKALSHQLGGTPEARLKKYSYEWIWFGENIALGQNNPEDVVASWENSPPHKKNMLDSRATEIGYTCYGSSNGKYHCLILAKPK